MKIESTSSIPYPRDAVLDVYRDQLPALAAYLPDVKEIVVHNRSEDGDVVTLENEWISSTDIPGFLSKILKPEHLRWDDTAKWNANEGSCNWNIKTRAFSENVTCFGVTTLIDKGQSTEVTIRGELKIDLDSLPGVPSFVARKLGPKVESFIVKMITPNLEKTNEAIASYLRDRE